MSLVKEDHFEEEVSLRNGGWSGESRKISFANWCEDCWTRIFSWFMEYSLQRKQGMQEGQTEKKEMRQQAAKNESHEIYDREIQIKNAEWTQTAVGGSVSCWPLIARKRGLHPGWEETVLRWYSEMKKKDEESGSGASETCESNDSQ